MKSFCTQARASARSTKTKSLQRIGTLLFVFFTLIAFTAINPLKSLAGQAGLAWNASSGAIGYKIYYGTAPGNYSQNLDVGNVTSYNVSSLIDGQTYYFAAKAYDSAGALSGYSNEVSKTVSSTTPSTYAITATASSNGTITAANNSKVTTSSSGTSVISTVTVSSGASQTFSITPSSGYYVASVTVDGASVGAVTTYTFSNVTANHTIAATFAANTVNTYTLTASAGTGGSISPSGSVTVSSGASKVFTITPNSGYNISNVTVDGSSVGAVSTYTFSSVTANHTIAATFAANTVNTYTLTASAGTGGSISPSGSVSVSSGASKTFTITPNSGYKISDVTVDGSSVGAVSTYTFSGVTANHSISAAFSATTSGSTSTRWSRYSISASAGTGGSISPSGTASVRSGRSITYTITPSSGYKVAAVTVDGTSIGAVSSYTFSNVTTNHTISATFSATSTGSTGSTGSTIWPSTTVPELADAGPDNAVELGVRFTSDTSGYITGVRFYKASTNTGTHVANLWSNAGNLLATATFSGETASGWQQVNFSTPVAITANTVYVASYHTNVGHFSVNRNYFTTSGVNNAPLHVPANGGVYAYDSTSMFPNQVYSGSNYWVDVVFRP